MCGCKCAGVKNIKINKHIGLLLVNEFIVLLIGVDGNGGAVFQMGKCTRILSVVVLGYIFCRPR